jgi:hypothetical protein
LGGELAPGQFVAMQQTVSSCLLSTCKLLAEIGPEGWTPTQQPPELSHSLSLLSRRVLLLLAQRRKMQKLNNTEIRKYSADRRPKELLSPSVLSSHYSVSVSLQGVHYL